MIRNHIRAPEALQRDRRQAKMTTTAVPTAIERPKTKKLLRRGKEGGAAVRG
ncbi:hypothetical protein A2U01_0093446 [Trifolium medium]|uniref:Uncharacterized protein n=1 Tax=Trifolium medium TaxID=97028 RepID=A0A392UF83_9FABA|nr:hypothetical protein [Trifolium medium]